MNKKWIIYKHTNLINQKVYIGQTCESLSVRSGVNGLRYARTSPIFWKAIQKYGWENFSHEIIEDNISSKEEANKREQYWIKYYDCCILDGKDKGYNINRGGQGFTSEFASQISKQNWENEEYRQKFCKPVICVNTQKIYPSIIEASLDTGINKTGIAKACAKVHHSAGIDELGQMIQWEYYEEGKKYTYKDPKKEDKKFTKVICTTTGEIFDNITEAAKKYNINRSCISACVHGSQKTSGKLPDGTRLHWQLYYKEDIDE